LSLSFVAAKHPFEGVNAIKLVLVGKIEKASVGL
jgi:hypothetical protein